MKIKVTAAFPDFFYYIKTDSRSTGFKVEKAAHGLSTGLKVDVAWTVSTNAFGKRYMAAGSVALKGMGQVAPVGLGNAVMGGATFYRQDRVWHSRVMKNLITGVPEI